MKVKIQIKVQRFGLQRSPSLFIETPLKNPIVNGGNLKPSTIERTKRPVLHIIFFLDIHQGINKLAAGLTH